MEDIQSDKIDEFFILRRDRDHNFKYERTKIKWIHNKWLITNPTLIHGIINPFTIDHANKTIYQKKKKKTLIKQGLYVWL